MMWFTADLHLGDTNILHDMDRPFGSVEEMNRKVIDAINECVAVDDRLYILGDFTYRLPLAEAVRLRERIECQNVTLVRGNHDGDWEDPDVPQIWEDVRDYLEIAPGYIEGENSLEFLSYNTGNCDMYAGGSLTVAGETQKKGDLAFAVYEYEVTTYFSLKQYAVICAGLLLLAAGLTFGMRRAFRGPRALSRTSLTLP